MLSIAIFISGRGSNMLALMEAIEQKSLPVCISVILSDKQDAKGLTLAKAKHIPCLWVERPNGINLQAALQAYDVDYIFLAGYMRILPADFVQQWQGRIFNIHPSLLPSYKGLHTHKRVLKAGEKQHGCTVHLVNERLDDGEILGQGLITIDGNDDEESLAQKCLEQEHRLYPVILESLAKGELVIKAGKAYRSQQNRLSAWQSIFI